MIERNFKVKIIDKIKEGKTNYIKEINHLSKMPSPFCDLSDINIFLNEYSSKVSDIIWLLVEINKNVNLTGQISNESWLFELNAIVLFFLKKIELQEAVDMVKEGFYKLLLLSVAINQYLPGKEDNFIYRPLLCLSNTWKYLDINKLSSIYTNIKGTIFPNSSIVPALHILEGNINKVSINKREEWLNLFFSEKSGLNTLHIFAGNQPCITYEESQFVEYGSLRYDNKHFCELLNFGHPWPDIDNIKQCNLMSINNFFNDSRVTFLINIIEHSLFGASFHKKTEEEFISIFNLFVNEKPAVVPEIIEYIFDNYSYLSRVGKSCIAKLSKAFTDTLEDANIINKYRKIGMLLGPNAILKLKDLQKIRKESLLNPGNIFTFAQLLSDDIAISNIEDKDLDALYTLFDSFTDVEKGLDANLYIAFEKTLREKLLPRETLSNEKVKKYMLLAMWKWQKVGYKKNVDNLMKFEGGNVEAPSEAIIESNKEILNNPMNFFFRSDMSLGERRIVKDFISISEHPLSAFSNNISLRIDFPRESHIDDLEDSKAYQDIKEGSFQRLLFDYFKTIRDKYAYKFLNPFHTYFFFKSFFDRIDIAVPVAISFWFSDKGLYLDIKKKRPYASLSRYRKKKDYAMVTQLFPLLEDEITKYSALKGIVPLEFENNKNFAHRLQPQALLTKLIKKASDYYSGDIQMVGDLIWIYLLMYSEDGLNIRNNVVHGVDYPFSSGKLAMFFSITLLCLADIIKRNDMANNDEDGLFE